MAKGMPASSPISLAVIITLYMISLGVIVNYGFWMAVIIAPAIFY